MRPLRASETILEEVAAHARASYPDECCGFLIAGPDLRDPSAPRTLVASEPAENAFEGGRSTRFLLRPQELRAADRRAEAGGRAVVGFYHSHPDRPARPSRLDQENAWPGYSYLVIHVDAAQATELRAFELDPDSLEFRPVRLLADIGDGSVGAATPGEKV